MAGALEKSTEVMAYMQKLIKIPQIQSSMMELSKEMMKVLFLLHINCKSNYNPFYCAILQCSCAFTLKQDELAMIGTSLTLQLIIHKLAIVLLHFKSMARKWRTELWNDHSKPQTITSMVSSACNDREWLWLTPWIVIYVFIASSPLNCLTSFQRHGYLSKENCKRNNSPSKPQTLTSTVSTSSHGLKDGHSLAYFKSHT